MGMGALRALSIRVNLDVHGVPATVTRPVPDDTPIATRGIWEPIGLTEDAPGGQSFTRREERRVIALPRETLSAAIAGVPMAPKGTRIVTPDKPGGTVRTWRIDGTDRVDSYLHRVVVVAEPEF